ncbi:MAG: efflux RND transporter permease subunit [bacterium]|nr:efflux RND transporter permease subunit [bacterium]
MSVVRFSVRQVVLVNLLFFVCIFAGVLAYLRTPIDFYPDISFNMAIITTTWAGASAREVEQLVTTEVEKEVESIDGIKEISSESSAGVSAVMIEWDETLSDSDYQAALNDVRAALDRVSDLPDDTEEPFLRELSYSEISPAVLIAVTDTDDVGEKALLEAADRVRRRMEKIEGVRKVIVRGEHEREVRVHVDRESAARHGLVVADIADAINSTNLNLPAGTFNSGDRGETTLRATGNFSSLEELAGTVVSRNRDGSLVRLSELATIEDDLEKRRFRGRFNGQPALILNIAKKNDSDLIEMAGRVDEWLATATEFLPEGIDVVKTLDTSRYVKSRMGVLASNLVTGIAFVMAILWFTVGFRNAALTVIAIPFSFLFAMILFPLMGMTINAITLVGMLLVSGMLVDDAIIVLENIYRRIETGQDLRDAVVEGTEEVMWPVIAAVATTAAAFAPLLLISGTSGEFFSIMPKTVIICLAASLFECLIILPAHYLDFGSRRLPGQMPEAPSGAGRLVQTSIRMVRTFSRLHLHVDRGIGHLRAWYVRALDVVLNHRAAFTTLILCSWLFSCGAASQLEVNLFPTEFDNFFVSLKTPRAFSLEQTDEIVSSIEKNVLDGELGSVAQNYTTYVGSGISGADMQHSAANLAMSYVTMTDTLENRLRPEHALQTIAKKLQEYRKAHPEGIVDLRVPIPRSGPPVGRPVSARIQSDDYERNKSISLEMQAYLHTLPGVFNIEDNFEIGPEEVRLVLDTERAHRHGLTFRDLALALRGANEGVIASSFREKDSDANRDIRVLLSREDRRGATDILQTQVRTPAGYLVRLGDVAELEVRRSPLSLSHHDGERAITVYADVDHEQATSESTNTALSVEFADISLRYPEVSVTFAGEFEATEKAFADMLAALPIALLLVYMILAAVFRSYVQPFVVITAVPFAFMGIVVGLHIFGYSVGMMLLYAFIGLAGVMVNDSLVMVDFINRARSEGMPLLEAVKNSGAARVRPILLTTLTTVLALMPMAFGLAGSSKSYGPFAVGISFGLMVGMLGTLFCVPLFYTLLIHGLDRVGGFFGRKNFGGAQDGPLEGQVAGASFDSLG